MRVLVIYKRFRGHAMGLISNMYSPFGNASNYLSTFLNFAVSDVDIHREDFGERACWTISWKDDGNVKLMSLKLESVRTCERSPKHTDEGTKIDSNFRFHFYNVLSLSWVSSQICFLLNLSL